MLVQGKMDVQIVLHTKTVSRIKFDYEILNMTFLLFTVQYKYKIVNEEK